MRIILSDKMTNEEKKTAWHCINVEMALRQSINRRVGCFEIIIPYEKRTDEVYVIDPDLEKSYFHSFQNNKTIVPVDEIQSDGNYRFKIIADDYYLQTYGILPINIMLFSHRISDTLAKNICNIIIGEYGQKWENEVFVRADGLYGDIGNAIICRYSDFGLKRLDAPPDKRKLKPYDLIIREKGLAYRIAHSMELYRGETKFISETYSESYKDEKDTCSSEVNQLGMFNVVIKRAIKVEKNATLRDW